MAWPHAGRTWAGSLSLGHIQAPVLSRPSLSKKQEPPPPTSFCGRPSHQQLSSLSRGIIERQRSLPPGGEECNHLQIPHHWQSQKVAPVHIVVTD